MPATAGIHDRPHLQRCGTALEPGSLRVPGVANVPEPAAGLSWMPAFAGMTHSLA